MTSEPLAAIWHEDYEVDIGPHVFPTRKYRLVRDRLLQEGTLTDGEIARPRPATDEQVGLAHSAEYIHKIKTGTLSIQEQLRLEVPFSEGLRRAMWLCAGGTILTCRRALERGVAVHLGGGFHHAFPDHGEGFCLINDVAIALRALHTDGTCARSLVLDLDVHHGNGTAAIFDGDQAVFTLSVHQEHNYPAWKPTSDLDLGLEDGTTDDEYMDVLERYVSGVLSRHQPDLAVYLAGADPYGMDQLGGLGLSLEGLRRRDRYVFAVLRSSEVPVAVTLAGGYAVRPDDTVEIHCNTVREARKHA